jgi:hypothetical protein
MEADPTCNDQLANEGAADCYTIQECERPEDVVSAADAALQCLTDRGLVACASDAIEQNGLFQRAEAAARGAALEAAYETGAMDAIADIGTTINDMCKVQAPERLLDRKDNGGSPSNSNQNKSWALSLATNMSAGYGAKPGPFGIVLPKAHAMADLDITAKVMGHGIPVVDLLGAAVADVSAAEVYSEGSVKLFGQDVASLRVGANLREGVTSQGKATSPSAHLEYVNRELEYVGSMAKGTLGQLTRVYEHAVRSATDAVGANATGMGAGASAVALPIVTPEIATVTRSFCKNVLSRASNYVGKEIVGQRANDLARSNPLLEVVDDKLRVRGQLESLKLDPICDAPLTAQTAKLLMDKMIDRYHTAVDFIDDELAKIMSTDINTDYAPLGGLNEAVLDVRRTKDSSYFTDMSDSNIQTGQGFYSRAQVLGAEQEYSLLGAVVVFPIGPIALVLDLQGTGAWGLNGEIKYGFTYNLANAFQDGAVPLEASATASVQPFARLNIDAYVGAGFDIGAIGVSIGIKGNVTLLRIQANLGGGIKLQIRNAGSTKLDGSPLLERAWPPALANLSPAKRVRLPSVTMTRFEASLAGTAQAGMTISALDGEISLAARLRVLFFRKTWAKRLASLAGYNASFNWVGERNGTTSLTLPNLNYDVLPSVPFPDVSAITLDQFRGLASSLTGVTLPSTITEESLGDAMLAGADFFAGGWLPGASNDTTADPWLQRGEYPDGSELVVSALDTLLSSAEFRGFDPVNLCGVGDSTRPKP